MYEYFLAFLFIYLFILTNTHQEQGHILFSGLIDQQRTRKHNPTQAK